MGADVKIGLRSLGKLTNLCCPAARAPFEPRIASAPLPVSLPPSRPHLVVISSSPPPSRQHHPRLLGIDSNEGGISMTRLCTFSLAIGLAGVSAFYIAGCG